MADEVQLRIEADAYRRLETLRWGDTPPECVHCGAPDAFYLEPADGLARTTRTGARSARRVWKCRRCRRQFSVLTGTPLGGTRIPVSTWLALAEDVAGAEESSDVVVVAATHGLSRRSAASALERLAHPELAALLAALATHPGAAAPEAAASDPDPPEAEDAKGDKGEKKPKAPKDKKSKKAKKSKKSKSKVKAKSKKAKASKASKKSKKSKRSKSKNP